MSNDADIVLHLQDHPNGVILPVRAHPKAKKNNITGVHNGRLKVSVTQPPERGRANDAIIQVLARSLDLNRNQINLNSGATSQQKTFLIESESLETLQQKVSEVLK